MSAFLKYVCGDIEAYYDDEDFGIEFKNEITNYLKWELLGKNKKWGAEKFMPDHVLSFPWQYADDELFDGKKYKGEDGQGNPPVKDPLTVYLTMYVGADSNGVTFKTSLSKMIDDVFEIHLIGDDLGDHISIRKAKHFQIFRDALYKEVEKLDKVIAEARDE
jgi:hypothetical protein